MGELTLGQKSRLVAALTSMYRGAVEQHWAEAYTITDLLTGRQELDPMDPSDFARALFEQVGGDQ